MRRGRGRPNLAGLAAAACQPAVGVVASKLLESCGATGRKVQGSTAHSGVRVSSGAREGGGCTKGCTERLERRPRGGGAISLAATWLGAQWRRCESCLEQLSFCVNTIVYHARPWLCVGCSWATLLFCPCNLGSVVFLIEAKPEGHTTLTLRVRARGHARLAPHAPGSPQARIYALAAFNQ